jgi:hypothetical protein
MAGEKSDGNGEGDWTHVGVCDCGKGPTVQRFEYKDGVRTRKLAGPRWCITWGDYAECCERKLDVRLMHSTDGGPRIAKCYICGTRYELKRARTDGPWMLTAHTIPGSR